MVKPLIVGNWKMNPGSFREGKKLLEGTKKIAAKAKHAGIVVAPPSIYLYKLAKEIGGGKAEFAVQRANAVPTGAYTGQISLKQAKEGGASYVIIGHAETREAGETDEAARAEVGAALALSMTPILCVGEKVRGKGAEHFETVARQLRIGLEDVPVQKIQKVIISYEPLWTIGGGSAMLPRDMHEMSIFIKKTLVELYGPVGQRVKILYGGSMNDSNVRAMFNDGGVSGFLVGGASLDPKKFGALLDALK